MDANINLRILVVDDSPDILQDFINILSPQQSGYADNDVLKNLQKEILNHQNNATSVLPRFEIDTASQGQEAVDKVKEAVKDGRPYALAFVDIKMPPGWNGIETIKHIWAIDSEMQIVICTAYSDYTWEEIINLLGPKDNLLILKKPFDITAIRQLASALTRKWTLLQKKKMQLEELAAQKCSKPLQLVAEAEEINDAATSSWQADIEPKTFWLMLKSILNYLKPHKTALFLYGFCLVVQIAFLLALPLGYRMILDDAIPHHNFDLLTVITVFILGGLLIRTFADFFAEYLMASLGTEVSAKIRLKLLTHLKNQSFDSLEKSDPSNIISGFSEDIVAIENAMVNTTSSLIISLVLSGISLIMIFFLSWPLAVTIIALLLLSLIVPFALKNSTSKAMQIRLYQNLKFLNVIQEFLINHLIIRVYGLSQFWIKKANLSLKESTQANKRSNILVSFTPRSLISTSMFTEIFIILVGAVAVMLGKLTIGTVFSCLIFCGYFVGVANVFSLAFPIIQKAALGMTHINALLQTPTTHDHVEPETNLADFKQQIQFNNVAVKFSSNQTILENISLTIAAGSSIAFVGPSGSGKTVMMKLLLMLYKPTSGTIIIDNQHNLNSISRSSWYNLVAVVTQEPLLFNATIEENIRMGKMDATKEEIIRAATLAGLAKDIEKFSQGYDTLIGSLGEKLSTGQKQRIAIARALIRQPRILLLDEVTSALDAITSEAIDQNLLEYGKGCTTIMITHHLRPAIHADHIYVFNHGFIVEHGTHDELLALGGLYKELWEKQHTYQSAY